MPHSSFHGCIWGPLAPVPPLPPLPPSPPFLCPCIYSKHMHTQRDCTILAQQLPVRTDLVEHLHGRRVHVQREREDEEAIGELGEEGFSFLDKSIIALWGRGGGRGLGDRTERRASLQAAQTAPYPCPWLLRGGGLWSRPRTTRRRHCSRTLQTHCSEKTASGLIAVDVSAEFITPPTSLPAEWVSAANWCSALQ